MFVGISADDVAAGGHLSGLRQRGINLTGHYWFTSRNDSATRQWAQQAGIQQIFYDPATNDHPEIAEFAAELRSYTPVDPPVAPVAPSHVPITTVALPEPSELIRWDAKDIRKVLNAEASRILRSGDADAIANYQIMWKKYRQAIHRAWFVDCEQDTNELFQYKLTGQISKGGAFGQVFEAQDEQGGRAAIKLLHHAIVDEPGWLEAFRRGVAAMQILASRKIAGIVGYKDAWEIPTCTVMEKVDGPDLFQAVQAGYIEDWETRVKVGLNLVKVIRAAHQIPERVLHRDIRPPNIMLRNFDTSPDDWELVVLDFDLAWHRDATGLSIELKNSASGYLAPEQIDENRQPGLSRNALVDSFGIGMTLYFLVSGKHPFAFQQRHGEWANTLRNEVASKACGRWKSLPRRFARLIQWATQDEQVRRWDLSRLFGELQRLQECLSGFVPASAELVCEEIATRCEHLKPYYNWDIDRLRASLELNTGFDVTLQADESTRAITLDVDWSHAGDREYENVRKFVGPASEKAAADLRGNLWNVTGQEVQFNRVRIHAGLELSKLTNDRDISTVAKALSTAIGRLYLR